MMQGNIVTADTPVDVPSAAKGELTIHTLSVFVSNKPGVLARIAQTFARRGFNIESLVVSPAIDGQFSRMTIGVSGDRENLDQIIKQANKLIDVVHCYDHTFDQSVVKELAMIKIGVGSERRSEALQIAEHFGARTVDLTPNSMILMVTGDSAKVDALMNMISQFKMIEMVRTGKVVMLRGEKST